MCNLKTVLYRLPFLIIAYLLQSVQNKNAENVDFIDHKVLPFMAQLERNEKNICHFMSSLRSLYTVQTMLLSENTSFFRSKNISQYIIRGLTIF